MEDSQSSSFLIKDMVQEERPREKALQYGIKNLTTTELMAIIFSTGVSGKSVIQLSNEILADADGHLSKVARMSVAELLRRYKGIGKAKALSLLAALELGSRAGADARAIDDPIIRQSADAYEILREKMERLPHEEFWVMMLSRSNRVIKCVNVSRGGLAATAVDVKVILKQAIDCYASSMILAHNHPSGNLTPSGPDDSITDRIVQAAKLLEMKVLDHLIIADSGYYSYQDNGRL